MQILLLLISLVLFPGNIFSQNSDSVKMNRKPLTEVFKEYEKDLLSVAGVQGFYQGALENGDECIIIMVDKYSKEIEKALPDSLEGYPIKIEVTGKIKPLDSKKKSPEK